MKHELSLERYFHIQRNEIKYLFFKSQTLPRYSGMCEVESFSNNKIGSSFQTAFIL